MLNVKREHIRVIARYKRTRERSNNQVKKLEGAYGSLLQAHSICTEPGLAKHVSSSMVHAARVLPSLSAHRIVRSTNSFSNLPTSCLNVSTSFQQSSGRRSWVLRHVTTASLALFRSASTCSSFLRCSSLARSCSISFVTLVRLMSCWRFFSARVDDDEVASASFSTKEGSDCWGSSSDSVSLNLEKSCVPCSRSFSSSAVRRSWYASSCAFERVASVCAGCQRPSIVSRATTAGRLTKVFFCSESTSSFENRTGWSLRANLSALVRALLAVPAGSHGSHWAGGGSRTWRRHAA